MRGLVEAAAVQAESLGALEGRAARNATTLVVARPPLAAEFGEFLAVAEAVDDFIDDSGLRGTVQVRRASVTTAVMYLMILMSAFVLPPKDASTRYSTDCYRTDGRTARCRCASETFVLIRT